MARRRERATVQRGWTVEVYREDNGDEPVLDFMRELNQGQPKGVTRIIRQVDLLRDQGLALSREHIATMANTDPTIWELRATFGRNPYRVLFYQAAERTLVLLSAFLKKTDAVPRDEIERAERRARHDRERRQ